MSSFSTRLGETNKGDDETWGNYWWRMHNLKHEDGYDSPGTGEVTPLARRQGALGQDGERL